MDVLHAIFVDSARTADFQNKITQYAVRGQYDSGWIEGEYIIYEAFQTIPPGAYEILLLYVMLGDAMLFIRADQVEAA